MSVRRSLIACISLVMLLVVPGSALAGTPDGIPPSVVITTPTGTPDYLLNQVVFANYSCQDTGGSGLDSCDGPVISGAAIDTYSLGVHFFTVTAFDNAGNHTVVSEFYTVLADSQPDARIRRIGRTNMVGNDIYNGDASGQSLGAGFDGAAIRRFVITLQNDSDAADSFGVSASGAPQTGFHVSYHHGHPGTDITSGIEAGTFTTPTIQPGAVYRIRVYVTVDAVVGAEGISRLVTATSVGNSSRVDAVRFTIGTVNTCLAAC